MNRIENQIIFCMDNTKLALMLTGVASHRVDRFDVYLLYCTVLPLYVDGLVLLLKQKWVEDESSRVDRLCDVMQCCVVLYCAGVKLISYGAFVYLDCYCDI